MSLPVYIGDEVSAQGYRLAGINVRIDDGVDLAGKVRRAREQAPLVMLSAALANRLPAAELEALLVDTGTPLVIVPDVRGNTDMPDLGQQLRRQLGVWE